MKGTSGIYNMHGQTKAACALFLQSPVVFHTDKTQRGKRAPEIQSHNHTRLSSFLLTDLLIFQSATCTHVFVYLIFLEQRLSQTITHWDGSLLLHNEMKLKCLIDFSFTFLTGGEIIVSARGHTRWGWGLCSYC